MMKEHFGTFLTTVIALIVILILTRVAAKWRRRRQVDREAGFH